MNHEVAALSVYDERRECGRLIRVGEWVTTRPAVPDPKRSRDSQTKTKRSYQRRWESMFGRNSSRCHPLSLLDMVRKEGKPTLLLVTLGVCVELMVTALWSWKDDIVDEQHIQASWYYQWFAWCSFTIIVALVACVATRIIDREAAGSGIPEMKTIISCDQRKEADLYLSGKTLVSKAVGLALAIGSGISVGREGPFVHTASIIVHRLMKRVPFFHRIYNNDILRRHMYNAACAVGVASTFRSPVGGVLFSIEVTSTIFMLTNYWRAFIAACSGAISRQIIGLIRESGVTSYHPLFPTSFSVHSFSYREYVSFGVLGIIMGFGGALYVVIATHFRRWWRAWSANHQFLWSTGLLVIISTMLFLPGEFSQRPLGKTLVELFSANPLSEMWETKELPSVLLTLPVAAVCRFVTTIFSTSLLLPAGDFIPQFGVGALLGRMYGEILLRWFPHSSIVPGGYALVGGAAFAGAATHTISVAVIALEFTGQFIFLLPILLAVLLATAVASALSVSIYESVIITKGLTYLPMLRINQLENVRARDVMNIEFPVLAMKTTLAQMQRALALETARNIPIVDSLDAMIFCGCVNRDTLHDIVDDLTSHHLGLSGGVSGPSATTDAVVATKTDERRLSVVVVQTASATDLHPQGPHAASPVAATDLVVAEAVAVDTTVHLKMFAALMERLDSSALQVDTETPLEKVHLFFEMIKCARIWVTRRGRLIGVIRRQHLHARVKEFKAERDRPVQLSPRSRGDDWPRDNGRSMLRLTRACVRQQRVLTATSARFGVSTRVGCGGYGGSRTTPLRVWSPWMQTAGFSSSKKDDSVADDQGSKTHGVRSRADAEVEDKFGEIKRLMNLYKPEKKPLMVSMTALALSTTITMCVPFGMGKIIDVVTSVDGATQLPYVTGALGGLFVLGSIANFIRVDTTNMIGERITNRLRQQTYESIMKQDLGFFDSSRTGELINRLSADTTLIGKVLSDNVSQGLRSSAQAIGSVSMLFVTCPKLGMVMLAIVPPLALGGVSYGRFVKKLTTQVQKKLSEATELAEEKLGNIRIVRWFAKEEHEIDQHNKKVDEVLSLARQRSLASATFFGGVDFSVKMSMLAVLGYGGQMVADGIITGHWRFVANL
ncbi:TPA: hypothetical protein N0F65_002091 [Lagenidium giganteum]|uniref:ABC transmembrane type-1 domain-containing protein n=1 Tax=Lagenidium giganteum TaxID=4803 RepID=A0AAV2ZEF8_9STRA|nr:TPA: hypothetical protein N0F65_002091 [Lagenidium giganteum]